MTPKKTSKKKANDLVAKEKKRKNQPVPPEITEARERRAYELRVIEGRKLYEITDTLNIEFPAYPLKSDHEAVRKMILRVQAEYAKRDKAKIDEVVAESSLVIDWVRKEAMDGFIASKQAEKVATQREQKLVEQKVKSQTGDPMFLKRITETVEVKAKLFGALAAKKHELTGKDGAPLGASSFDMNKLKEHLSDGDLEILFQATEIIERAQRAHDLAVQGGDTSRESTQES